MPAETWDSYKDTLINVLIEFQPKTILEWGSGDSTKMMSIYPSVESITTIEHDPEYFNKQVGTLVCENVTRVLIKDLNLYPMAGKNDAPYDFIFIDGRRRVECLKEASQMSNLVMLHDADRPRYTEGLDLYKHKIFTDRGCTCTMTNDEETFKRLKSCLSSEMMMSAPVVISQILTSVTPT